MTMKVQSLTDLQDRRIMLDRDVPPYGYAFVILVGIFMVFLLVWSTQTNRIYVSQNTGTVTAIDSDVTASTNASYYKMTIKPDTTYVVSKSGDKVDLSNGMSVTARVEYDQITYFEYAMEALGVLFH